MAEAVFTHIIRSNNLVEAFRVDRHATRSDNNLFYWRSAGTAGYHVGDNPDARSVKCCQSHGVPVRLYFLCIALTCKVKHKARQVQEADFADFDYILCMDESNYSDLMEMRPRNAKAQVKLLGDYDPQGDRIVRGTFINIYLI
jgi:low molecular weight phosphotyrosine protein phosphatase